MFNIDVINDRQAKRNIAFIEFVGLLLDRVRTEVKAATVTIYQSYSPTNPFVQPMTSLFSAPNKSPAYVTQWLMDAVNDPNMPEYTLESVAGIVFRYLR